MIVWPSSRQVGQDAAVGASQAAEELSPGRGLGEDVVADEVPALVVHRALLAPGEGVAPLHQGRVAGGEGQVVVAFVRLRWTDHHCRVVSAES